MMTAGTMWLLEGAAVCMGAGMPAATVRAQHSCSGHTIMSHSLSVDKVREAAHCETAQSQQGHRCRLTKADACCIQQQ